MFVTVYMTAANGEEAERIAQTLVEEKLAACANFFPCRSVYRWKGEVEKESEYVLICKTKRSIFQQLQQKVKEIHSYDVPAIVTYDIVEGSSEFLKWVGDSTIDI